MSGEPWYTVRAPQARVGSVMDPPSTSRGVETVVESRKAGLLYTTPSGDLVPPPLPGDDTVVRDVVVAVVAGLILYGLVEGF